MRRGERPVFQLPGYILIGLMLAMGVQVFLHQQYLSQKSNSYESLSVPFSASVYKGLSMGSDKLFSYLLVIRLQLHDNQAGRHIRYREIDYSLLVNWLDQIYQLNPESEYPMVLASGVYSQTHDKKSLRILLKYIDEKFTDNPQLHWRRQAESTVVAKHQLGDLNLALRMAEKLSKQPMSIDMPRWARDMHFLLLGDMNEFESAIVIIRNLLEGNAITDNDEKRFLKEKLLYFQQKLTEFRQES